MIKNQRYILVFILSFPPIEYKLFEGRDFVSVSPANFLKTQKSPWNTVSAQLC